MGTATVILGDCLDVMAELVDESVDSIVTDPPYGLGFMGKAWDALPPGEEWARGCLRVLKPGGHLLAFGGTRTWHRLAVAVEDAGFEVRDSIAWLYGSGFPKSLNLVDESGERTGWGTALKPAFEPVVVARKPLAEGTVAANVLAHRTGALNIDGCRIEGRERTDYGLSKSTRSHGGVYGTPTASADFDASKGRWPANVVLDESQAAALDEQSGYQRDRPAKSVLRGDGSGSGIGTDGTRTYGKGVGGTATTGYASEGGASRFFYVAKAPKSERPVVDGVAHPTVKPLSLMRWLVRLVTPPGGSILEPFAGSGTTVEAALLEGFNVIGIEREAEYLPLIEARIARAQAATATTRNAPPSLFDLREETA